MSLRTPRPTVRHTHAMANPRARFSESVHLGTEDAAVSREETSIPTECTPPSAEELRKGLATLPQELYDDIYNLTFTATSGVRDIGKIISLQNDGSTVAFIDDAVDYEGSEPGIKLLRSSPGTPFLSINDAIEYEDSKSDIQVFCSSPGRPFLGEDSCALLQVDRASRAQFAASYYGGVFYAGNKLTAQTWIRTIPRAYRELIREVRIVREDLSLGGSPFRKFYLHDVSSAFMGIRREVARRLQRRHPGARLPGPETAQDTRSHVRVEPYIESLALDILRTNAMGPRASTEWRAYRVHRERQARRLEVGESRRPWRSFYHI